jgi:glutathione S-transferase
MYSNQLNDLFNTLPTPGTNNTLMASLFRNGLKLFENRLINNNGFIAGTRFTYADLHLSAILENLKEQKNEILREFPNVMELDRKLRSMPRIMSYLQNRPAFIY